MLLRKLSGAFIAGLLFTGICLGSSPQTSVDITVQVYNWAQVPPEILAAAEGEGARVFKDSGIGIVWLNCPLSVAEASASPVCAAQGPRRPFVVRILYDVPPRYRNTIAGVTLNDTYATIFYRRIEKLANGRVITHSQMLGHAIAHELGHLLLGSQVHACFGIMRGSWDAEDLRAASRGGLGFSSWQSALIRDAANGRAHRQIPPD